MPEEQLLNPDELDAARSYPSSFGQPRPARPHHGGNGATPLNAHPAPERAPHAGSAPRKRRFNVAPDSFAETLLRSWYIPFFAGAIALALGILAGLSIWKSTYLATAQLMRNNPGAVSELFHPQDFTTETLVAMIRNPEVLRKTGERINPRLTARQVSSRLKIEPERTTEITNVTAGGLNRQEAVTLVNIFCEEAVRYTKELQRVDAANNSGYVSKQLAEAEADLKKLRSTLPAAVNAAVPSARNNERLDAAREELATLLVRYTEQHPLVREQRAKIAILTEQASAAVKPNASGSAPQDYEMAIGQLRTAESAHAELLARNRIVELVKADPPGYFRVTLAATPEEAAVKRPWLKIVGLGFVLCALAVAAALGLVVSREFMDNRLKSPADVQRVTQLPVLATLADVKRMSVEEQHAWAFRTWIAVQNRLTRSTTRGLICGFTSSRKGDGRSTWIRLIAHAASQCGFRVLTITTSPADARASAKPLPPDEVPPPKEPGRAGAPTATPPPQNARSSADSSLSTNVLTAPTQIADKLKSPDSQPMVHIPLPGWVWNLDRRKQWHSALELWRKIDNVVILVELPPASVPEAVLLAENVPHVIWVADGRSDALETRTQIETLRNGRANLVGSVLNRARSSLFEGRFARWFGCLAVLSTLALNTPSLHAGPASPAQRDAAPRLAQAAPVQPPYMQANEQPRSTRSTASPTSPVTLPPAAEEPAPHSGSFSITSRSTRAEWQKRLTLGPGDVLNLGLYGQPDASREEVPIGPDGRISFLEAHNVQAAGLTVDELRQKLADELGKFRRSVQPIVQPVTYRSKKYFVLGKVVQKGVFPLDRPITVIEAVARARGLETGLADRNLVELADLSRSFLSRQGKKVPVNFEKLFLEGDLSQNVPLEPDDYLYFPATDLSEVYVLGEVRNPGVNVFAPGAGAVSAIAARGGFTERAWSKRLLVIRGSLNKPETFVVDANEVLLAKSPDFKLQPRDIVYVSNRPWIRAEELLDTVASSFVEAAVVTWTGVHLYDTNQ